MDGQNAMIAVGSERAILPTGLSPKRARRWVLLRLIRDLRLSVAHGRTISLPNLLRLYRRRTDALAVADVDLSILRDIYLLHQPFNATLPRVKRFRRPG